MAGVRDIPGSPATERWISSLSPRKRSCVSYSNLEPCVNKAIQSLLILKQELQQDVHKLSFSSDSTIIRLENTGSEDDSNDLVVRGRASYHSQSPSEHERYSDFIEGALFLILRLDKDTRDTTLKLEAVKEKVCSLRKTLDIEAVRRMILLREAVQEEHEACMRDLLELTWHVSYEGRNLNRHKHGVTTTAEKNEELKKKVKFLNDQIPFLKDKLILETEEIGRIKDLQIEANVALKDKREELVKVEAKLEESCEASDKERNHLTSQLNAMEKEVNLANERLAGVLNYHVELVHKTNLARTNVANNQQELLAQGERRKGLQKHYTAVRKDVENLLQQSKDLEKSNFRLIQTNETLKAQMELQRRDLETQHTVLLNNMQQEHKQLKRVRDKVEELRQELDTMRDNITQCVKLSEDNTKSVERAKLELVKLDQQLQVSLDEYSKVRELNHRLENKMQLEKAVSGEAEQSLKNQMSALQSQVKEESRAKTSYMTQISLEKKELNILRTFGKSKLEKQVQLAKEANENNDEQQKEVVKVEEEYEEKKKQCELLEEELNSLKQECARTEQNLTTEINELRPCCEQLKVEAAEKEVKLREAKEKLSQLDTRIEDLVKSLNVLEKKETQLNDNIATLQKELTEVQDQINYGHQVEERLKGELKELEEFSANVEVKYNAYMKERTEYLERNKDDLSMAFEENDTLVKSYQSLQCQFIEVKTAALTVIERKLELESSIQDHKQLLSLQCEQHKALEDYYKHRGLAGRKFLNALRQQSVANSNQIKKLTEKFEVTIKEMHQFLQSSSATARKKPTSEKTSGRKVHFNSQLLVSTLD